MRGTAWRALAVASALAVAPSRAAAGSEAPADGAVAPADCWLMDGGCAARTSRSLTRPLTGAVEAAWTQEFKGSIEGDPLVFDLWVFVSVAEAETRTLYVLDLAKGGIAARKSFKTPVPLTPCLGSGLVVVRSGPTKVEALRWKAPELWSVCRLDLADGVESFVLFARELYVRHGGAVARYEVGRREPTWERSSGFRGRLALRGDRVFAVNYDATGDGMLSALAREDGRIWSARLFGHHPGRETPRADDDPLVVAGERLLVVRCALPIEVYDVGGWNTAEFDARGEGPPRLWRVRGDTVEWGVGRLAAFENKAGVELFIATEEDGRGYRLADAKSRPELLARPLTVSFARRTAYFAGAAVDLDARELLWSSGRVPTGRMTPARGTVLLAESGGRLVALREARPTADAARIAARAPASVAGRAALRDGSVVLGTFALDAAAGTLVKDGRPPRTIALADVMLLEDAAGGIVVAGPDVDDVARALDAFLAPECAQEWAALAKLVAGCRDDALLRHVIGEAWIHGCAATDVAEAEARLRSLGKPPMTPKPDAALAAGVAEREKALAARGVSVAWDRANALPAGAPPGVLVDLLRVVLARDRKHAGAIGRLKSLLPADIASAGSFQASEWLDFAEALAQSPVQVVARPRADDPDPTGPQRKYAALLESWRPDLVALRSERLLLVSPVARPGALARCLAMGELVCTSLDAIFAKGAHRRAAADPLVLLLYEDELEYERHVARRDPLHDMSWTAGLYSPREKLARLYLPEDDDGFRRVMNVFAHELTHQWIAERCPLVPADGRYRTDRPGHWIVEGFASLIQEMRWDPRRRSWSRDAGAWSPGLVVGAGPDRVLSWPRLLATTAAQFDRIDHQPRFELASATRLDGRVKVSAMDFFYAQATVVCQYLFFADDGKRRDRLLDFVGAYYRGEPPSLEEAFGMDAAALGRAATEFAKASGK